MSESEETGFRSRNFGAFHSSTDTFGKMYVDNLDNPLRSKFKFVFNPSSSRYSISATVQFIYGNL